MHAFSHIGHVGIYAPYRDRVQIDEVPRGAADNMVDDLDHELGVHIDIDERGMVQT